MKKFFALAFGVSALLANADESLSLKIYSGAPDTIRTASTTIVAVTEPGAEASIGGESVHVYRTGSFGAKVDLRPGLNQVDVRVSSGARKAGKVLNIFYDTIPAPKREAKPAAAEARFIEPRYIETLPGAYLQYGNGQDRLGGSKMGFIDGGIVLKALGEKGSLYCVALGHNRLAYLPKEYSRTAVAPGDGESVNTGSWSVKDEGRTDRVSVSLPRRLAYHYATELEPSTITVDIFGATDNSNWITQRTLTLGAIEYVDFRQVDSDVYRVILRLKPGMQWGFHVGYEGTNLVIDVRHRPQSLALKNLTIGLDAGHGGQYPGAISPSGLVEKEVNLDIVNHVKAMLEAKGARVVMTRDGDTGPSMSERKRIWREGGVDLAVSVHNNSGGGALSSPGTAVLYKHLFCRPLAEAVTARLLETGLPLFGIVQNFNFSLNGLTEFPEVLVEGMFMSSLQEEEKLADPAFRRLVAQKIVAGIEDYLKAAGK
ncbi:MAG: N-acetylmuramoyl-L-alanine amidase [Muribaculaceae bacterium]|nr:N-acetylmuramoyl-L-alanine amidase [Muribaculaceae bacterium]